jgi:outer membrane protein OmpA-like peptidoglycan-associated protein
MKRYLLLFVLILAASTVYPQVIAENTRKAEDLFSSGNYSQAVPYFLALLKTDSLNVNLNYKTGVCYLHSRSQKEKAIRYLEIAVKDEQLSHLPPNACEQLGDCYLINRQYEKAKEVYAGCKGDAAPDSVKNQRLDWKSKMCDRSGAAAPDKIAFTESDELSLGFVSTSGSSDAYYHDFYHPLIVPKIIPDTSTKPVYTEATIGTSANGQHLLLYHDERGSAEICISSLYMNAWSVPQKLNRKMNISGWEEGEYISADDRTMYFVSDRAGGFGGKDIYKCERNSNGEWGMAVNMGPAINSQFDEEAPFIHPNGKLLYFSSGRYTGNNGTDIFYSRLESTGWSWPVKTGYPVKVNTSGILTEYSADVEKDPVLTFLDENNNRMTVITGNAVATEEKAPSSLLIEVRDPAGDKPFAQYRTHNAFAFILPNEDAIKIIYKPEHYLFRSEIIDLAKKSTYPKKAQRAFTPLSTEAIAPLDAIFFQEGKPDLQQSSEQSLAMLAELLKENENLAIELSGYIDSPENKRYNAKLSKDRVETMILCMQQLGVDKDRLIAKNYGHSQLSRKKGFEKEETPSGEQRIEMKLVTTKQKNNLLTNNK